MTLKLPRMRAILDRFFAVLSPFEAIIQDFQFRLCYKCNSISASIFSRFFSLHTLTLKPPIISAKKEKENINIYLRAWSFIN